MGNVSENPIGPLIYGSTQLPPIVVICKLILITLENINMKYMIPQVMPELDGQYSSLHVEDICLSKQ